MSPPDTPRGRLRTRPAPSADTPSLISFAQSFLGGTLTIAYVPDRDVLTADSLNAYLRAIPAAPLEETVAAIAADIANELVPKWHRVSLVLTAEGVTQSVAIEDRQPGWSHPSLLGALARPPSE